MGVTSSLSIIAGRDRMSAVLEPLLGFELARERANNLAQMLILGPSDVICIACGMLQKTGIENAVAVAEAVLCAWHEGIRAAEAREQNLEVQSSAREPRLLLRAVS